MKGKVVSGLGEGAFYVEKYAPLFNSELGFTPFHGTLNIAGNILLDDAKKVTITPEGSFQPVDCYPIVINKNYKAAIVKPHVTRHKEIIEIIAPVNLRETLQLQDGDEITCELE